MSLDSLVTIPFERLLQPYDDEMDAQLEKAYGFNGLGLLLVSDVPQYPELRQALLPMGYGFGNLPDDVKAKCVDEKSSYSFGWSHGKEKLEGKPDLAKGSFYNNPQYNKPCEEAEMIAAHPAVLSENIWPSQEDFPGMEEAFMGLGGKICEVGLLLTKFCDQYCQRRNPQFPTGFLERVIGESKAAKARLLYYFPYEKEDEAPTSTSSWCGAHLDSGSLTGLTSAIFFDKDGNQIACPDPKAGLYIKNRAGETIKAPIPPSCIAFQIGECIQIHSGGLLLATPHSVQAAQTSGVSRATYACFMQPDHDVKMALPPGSENENVVRGANAEHLPEGVPALLTRWDMDGSQTYAEFATKTFSMYY